MSTKEILIEARKIISNEKHWTKGAYSRDENGGEVPEWDQSAVCFCSIGAVAKASINCCREQNPAAAGFDLDAMRALANELKIYSRLSDFNDNSSHQEVLALFDKAIANCQ